MGDKAPAFNLPNVDGSAVSLQNTLNNNKGAIVIFTCNHCPFSIAYEDRINALNNKYKPLGYPVIAINPNDTIKYPGESFGEMKKRSAEKSFSFPYLQDKTQAAARAYGAARTPHVYIVSKDKKGDARIAYIGAIDDNSDNAAAAKSKFVEEAVDALLAGKKVPRKTTKAIGCTIKWRES